MFNLQAGIKEVLQTSQCPEIYKETFQHLMLIALERDGMLFNFKYIDDELFGSKPLDFILFTDSMFALLLKSIKISFAYKCFDVTTATSLRISTIMLKHKVLKLTTGCNLGPDFFGADLTYYKIR